ncbi:MAG: hypothetical protein ACK5G7_06145 [Erysipelotrichaceae bacterium]
MAKQLELLIIAANTLSCELLEAVQWDHKPANINKIKLKIRELELTIEELKKEINNDNCR